MKQRVSLRIVARAFAEVLERCPPAQRPQAVAACAKLLERQRLLHRAPRILELLDEELLARQGVRRAAVATADALEALDVARIERALQSVRGAPVAARVTTRPQLLAGFRAEVGDLLVDASVQGALARVRAQLRSRPFAYPHA